MENKTKKILATILSTSLMLPMVSQASETFAYRMPMNGVKASMSSGEGSNPVDQNDNTEIDPVEEAPVEEAPEEVNSEWEQFAEDNNLSYDTWQSLNWNANGGQLNLPTELYPETSMTGSLIITNGTISSALGFSNTIVQGSVSLPVNYSGPKMAYDSNFCSNVTVNQFSNKLIYCEPSDLGSWEDFAKNRGLATKYNFGIIQWSKSSSVALITELPRVPYPTTYPKSIALNNHSFTSIEGFNNVEHIDSDLNMTNGKLNNIDGFRNLMSVGLHLNLSANELSNVNGLRNLETVGGMINLYNNDLTNINGLINLKSVGGNFSLYNNKLTSLTGLNNLKTVEGSLYFYSNNLNDISALSNLTSIKGSLNLKFNNLTNLNGLENLVSVGDGILLTGNYSLNNIDAIANLKVNGGVWIDKGYAGPKLEADSIFCQKASNLFYEAPKTTICE